MATTITLKEAGIYFGEKLPKLQRAAALRGLASAAQRGLQLVQAEIIPSRSPQPVDRGVYRAGWRAVKIKDGYAVENLEPHAAFVEYGVRASNVKPGRAMIAALQEWARRHGFEDPLGAAWAIAKAMQKRGIWGGRGLGIHSLMNDRLRNGIVEEEVKREMARKT